MKRIGTLLMAMAVGAALLAIPLGVSAATSNHAPESATAGEQLGGVLGVQGAALDGDLSDRTFGQKIANADTDDARAQLIADRLNETEQQITDREARLADLETQRDAGEISEGRYRAQVATLEAERANTERAVDRADEAAGGLPASVRADRGINVDRIDDLRSNASQLGGPETSEAAREIAGENVTRPIAGDQSDRNGPTDRPRGESPATDRDTGESVDRADSDPNRQNPNNSDQDSSTEDRSIDTGESADDSSGGQNSDHRNGGGAT